MPKHLAEIVIDQGLVNKAEVLAAAKAADARGVPLITELVRRRDVDEVALVAAIRRHTRVTTADPATVKLDSDALREVSREVCRRLCVVPLSLASYHEGPRLLRLAMADPTDEVAIAEVEHVTGCRVEPVLVTLSAVKEMVEKGYGQFVTEVMRRSAVASRAETLDVAARLEAVIAVLVDKGVITEDELGEAMVAAESRRRG